MNTRSFTFHRFRDLALLTLLLWAPARAQVSVMGGGALSLAWVDQGPGSRGLWSAVAGLRIDQRERPAMWWCHEVSLAHARYRLDAERTGPIEHQAVLRLASGGRWQMPGDFRRIHAIAQGWMGMGIAGAPKEERVYDIGGILGGLQGGLGLHDGRWGVEVTYAQSVLDATPRGPAKTLPGMMCWQVVYRLSAGVDDRDDALRLALVGLE